MDDSIDFTNWGIIILVNEEHSLNVYDLIDVTDWGIITSFNDEHCENA